MGHFRVVSHDVVPSFSSRKMGENETFGFLGKRCLLLMRNRNIPDNTRNVL